jgi:hypothetical protein
MAGDATTFITRLLRSIIGENDWATEIRDNFEAISEYFAQTGTATLDELNDGTAAIEGEFYGQPYYNTEFDWLAVCSLPGAAGTGEWMYAANWLMTWAAANLSFSWEKGQTTKWVITEDHSTDYVPWITPNPDDSDQANGNYHLVQATGGLVTVLEPQGISGDAASIFVFAFAQGGGGSLAWQADVFAMSGGVTLPYTEETGEVDLFSCVRAPNGVWMVSPAFKFNVGFDL